MRVQSVTVFPRSNESLTFHLQSVPVLLPSKTAWTFGLFQLCQVVWFLVLSDSSATILQCLQISAVPLLSTLKERVDKAKAKLQYKYTVCLFFFKLKILVCKQKHIKYTMWHDEALSDLLTGFNDSLLAHDPCRSPRCDAPVAVWFLPSVLWRSLTYLLPLDSCCLFFYVTSSIFGVKLKAVSTFTMRKGLCLGWCLSSSW